MYVLGSRNKFLLLAERQFTRTFAAQVTGTKRKKATAKKTNDASKTSAKMAELEEKIDLPSAAYPFCLPKEQPILPSNPITIPHSRTDIDEGRFYNLQGDDETFIFPGVTHVISATRPRSSVFAMKNWEKNMTKEHGEEGFQKIRGLIRTQGHDFHKAVGDYLLNKEIDKSEIPFQKRLHHILRRLSRRVKGLFGSFTAAEQRSKQVKQEQQVKQERQVIDYLYDRLPETEGFAKSVEHVVKDISEVYAVESMVSHVNLGYVGTVDLVAKYKGDVCVIDWKTSQKPKPKLKDIHDYPLQTVAYAGAINDDKNYSFNVTKAVIVVVYISGAPADVHVFDRQRCEEYWREWLDRLDQFQKTFAHDLSEIVDG